MIRPPAALESGFDSGALIEAKPKYPACESDTVSRPLQNRHFSGFVTGSGLIIRPYFRRGVLITASLAASDRFDERHLGPTALHALRDVLEGVEVPRNVRLRVGHGGRPLLVRARGHRNDSTVQHRGVVAPPPAHA